MMKINLLFWESAWIRAVFGGHKLLKVVNIDHQSICKTRKTCRTSVILFQGKQKDINESINMNIEGRQQKHEFSLSQHHHSGEGT